MSNAAHTREQANLDLVLARAATDAGYRGRLLSDPNNAIEEVVGFSLAAMPRDFTIRFVEKSADVDALVVLPDYQDPEGALSDAELEAVAGGADDDCWWTCACSETTVKVETEAAAAA